MFNTSFHNLVVIEIYRDGWNVSISVINLFAVDATQSAFYIPSQLNNPENPMCKLSWSLYCPHCCLVHCEICQMGLICTKYMMTSSNGNIFRVTGPLCGEFTGPGEFPAQRPVTRSFDVFFDLRLNKRLNKQSWGWWFETLSRPFWRHRNDITEPCSEIQCCSFAMKI